jgi:hypothetical protein
VELVSAQLGGAGFTERVEREAPGQQGEESLFLKKILQMI